MTEATTFPMSRASGGLVYNLWKDAKNPRGLWRRTTLADFRNAEPGWETLLDIDRLAAEEDKDWLLSWTQPLPGNSRVIVSPFARRQRRGDAARVRSGHQGLRRRRIHPAGSQERGRMGRRRHAAAFERPWRGHGDNFRLCENRPAVAPRRARGTAPVLFEVPADRMAAYCSVDDTGANAADVVHRSDRFLQSQSLARHRGRSAHKARPADRHLAGSASTTGWP